MRVHPGGHPVERLGLELLARAPARVLSRTGEPERPGICPVTCHLSTAGYDLSTEAGYHEVMAGCDRVVGLEGCWDTGRRAMRR